jgi:hypothetical protein
MLIKKDKISRNMSYILRSSFLDRAMQDAGITLDVQLNHGSGRFFDACFWPPNANVPYERLYIQSGSVSSDQANIARVFVETTVIPELISWLVGLLALPSNSPIRRQEQRFHRDFC